MKKLLIVLFSTFSVIFIALLVIPNLFKDEIKNTIIKYVKENTGNELSFEDYNLSFITSFPNFNFDIEDLKVIDIYGKEILKIKSFSTDINSTDLIVDRIITVESLNLIQPEIYYTLAEHDSLTETESKEIERLNEKSESTEEEDAISNPISFNISKYEIRAAKIHVNNSDGSKFVEINNFNHNGYGVFENARLSLNTFTFIDDINVFMGETEALSHATVKGGVIVDLDLKNQIYSLKENNIALNNIEFNWVGVLKNVEDNLDIDLRFNTPNTKFSDVLELVPGEYKESLVGVETNGTFSIEGVVQGIYNDISFPRIRVNTTIHDGYLKYPDLPESIDDINVDMKISKAQAVDFDQLIFEVKQAKINLANNDIHAKLWASNFLSDPLFELDLFTKLNLEDLKKALPLEHNEKLNGTIDGDIYIKGRMSDLDNNNFDKFIARGNLSLKNLNLKSNLLKDELKIDDATMKVSPQYLHLSKFDMRLGKSDISANGKIENYLEYVLKDQELKGKLEINSNYIDFNDFILIDEADSTSTEETMEAVVIPGKINFENLLDLKKVDFGKADIRNINGSLGIKDETAFMKNLKMNIFKGSLAIDGNYSTKVKEKYTANLKLNLKDSDIKSISETIDFAKKIVPVIGNSGGTISSKLNFSSEIDKEMNPIISSINSKGVVETKNLTLKKSYFINQLGEILNVKELKQDPKVSDIKASFKIENGVLDVSPFDIKIADIKTNIKGKTYLEKQELDFDLNMVFPRKYLSSDANKIINDAVAIINNFGGKVSVGETINVGAVVDGKISDPKYSLSYGPDKAKTPEEFLKKEADKLIDDAKKDAGKELEKKANKLLKGLFK